MAKKNKIEPKIKLAHPDRSAPTEKTLLDLAQERNLFSQADQAEARKRRKGKNNAGQNVAGTLGDDEDNAESEEVDPMVDHVMDSFFYGVSLAMLHITLDVLVQHQYAMRMEWRGVMKRGVMSLLLFTFLVFVLHNHPGNEFLFGLPKRFQSGVRQAIFFAASVGCGCYLIYVTNQEGYLRVMKKAPPLGCLWVWSVIEMKLGIAVLSLMINGLYMWWAGLSLV